MMIDITGVRLTPSKEAFVVHGQVGLISRMTDVAVADVAAEIGGDPAQYDLADVIPTVVTLAFPKLVQAFK